MTAEPKPHEFVPCSCGWGREWFLALGRGGAGLVLERQLA